jgi:hypothetical protein
VCTAYNKDMNNNSEHTLSGKLLHNVKFGTMILVLYTISAAKDSAHAANKKRKSILSFCHEVKEVFFGEPIDDAPSDKTYKQAPDEL